jgi:hypothetical protein
MLLHTMLHQISPMPNDDFYIGYLDKAPPGLARFLRRVILALLVVAPVLAGILAMTQQPFYPSVFEFLQYRSFEGVVQVQPYPMLLVERPDAVAGLPAYSRYYLVQEGKFGAQEAIEGLSGRHVRLDGALIYRDDQTMIEIKPGTVTPVHDALHTSAVGQSLGMFTLLGEIVDSKCFLGGMNPGSQKVHRACAARCISGGIPPLFVVRDADGASTYVMLQGENGQTVNKDVLDLIAEPLEITGEVVRYDDLLVLKADPDTYQRRK